MQKRKPPLETLRAAIKAKDPHPTAKFVRPAQAAARLGVHPSMIYRLIDKGKLRASRLGTAILIPIDALGALEAEISA